MGSCCRCSDGKESACNVGDQSSIPGLGRSPGEGNGNHSSILAWRIPWMEEPDGLWLVLGVSELNTTEVLTVSGTLHYPIYNKLILSTPYKERVYEKAREKIIIMDVQKKRRSLQLIWRKKKFEKCLVFSIKYHNVWLLWNKFRKP